jgi:hypothetical protein
MHDEMNGQTSNQADRDPVSSSGEELHVLSAECLDLVAGGHNGTIIIE